VASGYKMPDGTDFDDYFLPAVEGKQTAREAFFIRMAFDVVPNYVRRDDLVFENSLADVLLSDGTHLLDRYMSCYEFSNNGHSTTSGIEAYGEGVAAYVPPSSFGPISGYVDVALACFRQADAPSAPSWYMSSTSASGWSFTGGLGAVSNTVPNPISSEPVTEYRVMLEDISHRKVYGYSGPYTLSVASASVNNSNRLLSVNFNYTTGSTTQFMTVELKIPVQANNGAGWSVSHDMIFVFTITQPSGGGGL
jgi:hypothetical protein